MQLIGSTSEMGSERENLRISMRIDLEILNSFDFVITTAGSV